MVCDEVYSNPITDFKKWYTTYEKNPRINNCQFKYCYIKKKQLKSINNVSLTTIASDKLRVHAIRLCTVYVCDDSHGEILETAFSRGELNHDEFIF